MKQNCLRDVALLRIERAYVNKLGTEKWLMSFHQESGFISNRTILFLFEKIYFRRYQN